MFPVDLNSKNVLVIIRKSIQIFLTFLGVCSQITLIKLKTYSRTVLHYTMYCIANDLGSNCGDVSQISQVNLKVFSNNPVVALSLLIKGT